MLEAGHYFKQFKAKEVVKRLGKYLLIALVAALAGRVSVMYGAAPFGAALIAAVTILRRDLFIPVVLGVLVGSFTLSQEMWFYMCVNALTALLCLLSTRVKKAPHLLSFASILLSYILSFVFFIPPIAYNIVSKLFEVLFACAFVYIFETALRTLRPGRIRSAISEEEAISLSFVAIVVVLGFGGVNIAGVYVSNVCAIFLAMLFSYAGGAGLGCACAVALGGAAALSGSASLYFIGNLGICALGGGILRRLNRVAMAAGFILMNASLSFLLTPGEPSIIPLIDALTASVAFIALPRRLVDSAARYVNAKIKREYERELHFTRVKSAAVGRLGELSTLFAKIGEMFKVRADETREQAVCEAIGEIARRSCARCRMKRQCWNSGFNETYEALSRLYAQYGKTGKVTKKALGGSFAKRCEGIDQLLEAASEVYGNAEAAARAKRQMTEAREITGEQLLSVSRVIEAMGRDMEEGLNCLPKLEENITRRLEDKGVRVYEAVAMAAGPSIRCDVKIRSCPGAAECPKCIEKAVSEAAGKPMRRIGEGCVSHRKTCTLSFEEAGRLSVEIGSAQEPFEKECGDSFSYCPLPDGRKLIVLCDGMGHGEAARHESSSVMDLIESFYKAGFDDKTVLDTVNRLMVLHESEDMFTTVDMCLIDPAERWAEFTKIGADRSFLLRGNELMSMAKSALPLGILEEFKPATLKKALKDGDVLIMMSDGVGDAVGETVSDWFLETVEQRGSAGELACRILAAARENAQVRDDMTVIVALISESGGSGKKQGGSIHAEGGGH